jgi:hypothetical protein
MSKDKGVKNVKKAPADKTSGKIKPISDYKSESKSKGAVLTVAPKANTKGDKS